MRRYTRTLLTESLRKGMQQQLALGLAFEGLGVIEPPSDSAAQKHNV